MEKWPSHLFATFLAGCFIVAIIFIFILITVIFSIPADHHRCRKARNVEIEESHNVYFVKHENRTWSRKELCYMETAARRHPDLHVYMINLVSENPQENESQVSPRVIEKQELNSFSGFINLSEQEKSFAISRTLKPEMILRKKIAYYNSNVRNIDLSTEWFFEGSMLSNVYKMLSSEMVEIAAKIYLLWNYPGVALNPVMHNSLNDLQQYFCDKTKDFDFTIELKGELQASGIPCHAFAGFLMQEIIKNRFFDQQHGLKRALNDFCPRIQQCPGVRILKIKSNYLSSGLFCPTIYPDGLFTDFEDVFQKTEDLTIH
ncbi:uncharacterized protein LOC117171433 isoform X2 [Belonocnema kinseyi]|nr:uncharacterized protein LOC117171433 isoform X2 [Belonocnema kinseyi]